MSLEYKRCVAPFEVKELVSLDGGGWEVSGYASSYHDENAPASAADFYGDLILPGAFTATIGARKTKFLYEHREPIGYQVELREDAVGLFGRWAIVDTAIGSDAYKLMKSGVIDGLSIGFFARDWVYREDGIRLLRAIDVVEVSGVATPADTNAVITDVKSRRGDLPFEDECDDVRIAVRTLVSRVRSGSDLRLTDGKAPLSESRRALLAEVSGSLSSAVREWSALLTPADANKPKQALPPSRGHDLDALRARLTRLGVLTDGSDPT